MNPSAKSEWDCPGFWPLTLKLSSEGSLEFDSPCFRLRDSWKQPLCQPGPRLVSVRVTCKRRTESVIGPLFCVLDFWVPLHGHVQFGRQLASLGSRLLSDGHSLNRVLPSLVVCAAVHVGLHTSYLCPGNCIPTTLPHSKAAGASWDTVLGEGARYFSSFHPF